MKVRLLPCLGLVILGLGCKCERPAQKYRRERLERLRQQAEQGDETKHQRDPDIGVGVTPSGKLGIEIAPGIGVDIDGNVAPMF